MLRASARALAISPTESIVSITAVDLGSDCKEVSFSRCDADNLRTVVSGLVNEMGVRYSGLRRIASPDQDHSRVVPISGLGHVGLYAPEVGESVSGRKRDGRNGRHGREDAQAIRAMLFGQINQPFRDVR